MILLRLGIIPVPYDTSNNETVFFAIRQPFDAGTVLTLRGTVKAHRDNQTQLNRVTVL